MDYLNFGRFTIPAALISSILALLFSGFIFSRIRKIKPGEWYTNAYLLFFLLYKLTYIVFNFSLFVKFPFSLLYFNGGTKGQIIAAGFTAFYLFRMYKKTPFLLYREMVPLYFLNFVAFQAAEGFLGGAYLAGIVQLVLFLALAFCLYRTSSKVNSQVFLFIFLIELMILSLFEKTFMTYNISFILIGLFLVWILYTIKEEKRN